MIHECVHILQGEYPNHHIAKSVCEGLLDPETFEVYPPVVLNIDEVQSHQSFKREKKKKSKLKQQRIRVMKPLEKGLGQKPITQFLSSFRVPPSQASQSSVEPSHLSPIIDCTPGSVIETIIHCQHGLPSAEDYCLSKNPMNNSSVLVTHSEFHQQNLSQKTEQVCTSDGMVTSFPYSSSK